MVRPAPARNAPGNLTERDLASDAGAQLNRKAADAQRPDVGEFRLIEDGTRDHEHRCLELVQRSRERGAIGHARVLPEIGGRHLPFAAQRAEDRLRLPAESTRLLGAAHPPHRVEVRDHPRGQERRPAARQLRVVELAARDDLVLQRPGQRGLLVLLDVPGKHRVAPSAHGDIHRWAWSPGVGQAGGKADVLDEPLDVVRRRNLPRAFPPPALVAIVLDFRRHRQTSPPQLFDLNRSHCRCVAQS